MSAPITLSVEITADRHLEIDLPPDTPLGRADLTIMPRADNTPPLNPAREAARAKLLAAGVLGTTQRAPSQAIETTPEERERIWSQFASEESIDTLIDEDRETY